MSIAAARLSVAQAEAAAGADVATGESDAASGAAQASAAYELAIQILRDGVVELAPALLALEVAAISEGIAAYLASEEQAALIEKEVFARAGAAANQLIPAARTAEVGDEAAFRTDAAFVLAASRVGVAHGTNVSAAVVEALARAESAVAAALARAVAGRI
jgi:hypothetical protein